MTALELRQEWQVRTDGAYHGRSLTLAEAEHEVEQRTIRQAAIPASEIGDWDRNPHVVTRIVGPWVWVSDD